MTATSVCRACIPVPSDECRWALVGWAFRSLTRAGEVSFQLLEAADQGAVDEHLRSRRTTRHGADHTAAHLVFQRNVDGRVTLAFQQALRFDAERAARLRKHHD